MVDQKSVGAILTEALTSLAMTLPDLSEYTGIEVSLLERLRDGEKSGLVFKDYLDIARVLKLGVDFLVTAYEHEVINESGHSSPDSVHGLNLPFDSQTLLTTLIAFARNLPQSEKQALMEMLLLYTDLRG